MEAWDKECPRCGGKGLVTPAAANSQAMSTPPPPATAAPTTSVAQAVAGVNMPSSQADKYADIDRNIDLWWEVIGGGIFLLLCAVGSYFYFTSWETSGGIRIMRWYIALAYQIGGKWPIIVVFALLGCASIGLGIREYFDLKRNKFI